MESPGKFLFSFEEMMCKFYQVEAYKRRIALKEVFQFHPKMYHIGCWIPTT